MLPDPYYTLWMIEEAAMRMRRLLGVVLAVAGGLLTAPAGAQPLEKFAFGTNWVAQAEHGGFYQALADGTYRRHGLDVTIVQGGPNINNRLQLSSREFPTDCVGCGVGLLDADRAMRSAEAITEETEPNNSRATANYVSAPADVAGELTAQYPFFSCNVTCGPPPKPIADQDWYLVELPPQQTLSAWVQWPTDCTSCYFDIIKDTGATATARFDEKVTVNNFGQTHEAVYVRIHSGDQPITRQYIFNFMWRDERRADGHLGDKPELR
jgi:hypothetical protein